jgi:hypothetical protein
MAMKKGTEVQRRQHESERCPKTALRDSQKKFVRNIRWFRNNITIRRMWVANLWKLS